MPRIKFRRGKSAEWTQVNPVLSEGEPGYATDGRQFKVGDGTTRWNDLPGITGSDGSGQTDQIIDRISKFQDDAIHRDWAVWPVRPEYPADDFSHTTPANIKAWCNQRRNWITANL